jgi:hypothetical protein
MWRLILTVGQFELGGPVMTGPEHQVEDLLRRRVKKHGGYCIKWVPVIAGLPDRLVLLPGGRIFLVELKAPHGRMRPVQVVWHRRFAKIGVPVVVLHSKPEVERWVDEQSRPVVQ